MDTYIALFKALTILTVPMLLIGLGVSFIFNLPLLITLKVCVGLVLLGVGLSVVLAFLVAAKDGTK